MVLDSDEQSISALKKQFLCCYPVNLINWKEILFNISWNEQKELLDQTVLCKENQGPHGVRHNYQLNFLKSIIENLEKINYEVHDSIYEAYCSLQTVSTGNIKNFAYKHYLLPDHNTLSLKESANFVTDGTTGLCSWQASIALSDYFLNNLDIVKGKYILELGSGTGLCSFTISKCCNASKVILSDGSQKVIDLIYENLNENFNEINLLQETEDSKLFKTEKGEIGIWHLPWENVGTHQIEDIILPEIILAADVIYDENLFEILTQTIDYFFNKTNNICVMYLAATVRNECTLNKFLKLLDDLKFSYEKKQHSPCGNKLFWDTRTRIEIFVITRKK